MDSAHATGDPNLGTIVFAGFALLSLVAFFAKGLVPIFLAEAMLWACIAWYWQKRGLTSTNASLTVMLCAVAVAAGEGYLIGRGSASIVEQPTSLFSKKQDASPAANDFWAQAESINQGSTPPPANPPVIITPDQPKKGKAKVRVYATVSKYEEDIYQQCAFNTGSTPCLMDDGPQNDFSGRVATLKNNDRVEILSSKIRAPNGTEIYKVRFQRWTGWMDASSLTLEMQ